MVATTRTIVETVAHRVMPERVGTKIVPTLPGVTFVQSRGIDIFKPGENETAPRVLGKVHQPESRLDVGSRAIPLAYKSESIEPLRVSRK